MPVNLAVTVNVPLPLVHNAIIGALEGAATYWLHKADLLEGFTKPDDRLVWWGHQEVFEQPFKIAIDLVSENDDRTTHDVFVQCLVLDDVVFG